MTLPAIEHVQSSHSNERWLVRLRDGAQVECVLYRGDTLCVSSQVGCAVSCPFCASGERGLARPLSLDELIGQVGAVQALGVRLARVTLSGVGEPLHNSTACRAFLEHCRERALRVSLTTSGGPLMRLREWLHAPHNGLTLSIHAGTESTRARMVPRGPALAELLELLRAELPRMTQRRRRKTALAYLLVQGENDSEHEIDAFIAAVRELPLDVHLYAYNPVPRRPYARLPEARYRAIYARMVGAGLRVRMSAQARLEENGGCGTLIALRRSA